MVNIWKQLLRPFFALAPMEDLTDTVFRHIVLSCGRPDVFFTEFTSVDGLFSAGKDRVIQRFRYTKEEHPIIAQIWGNNLDNYHHAAMLIKNMGFDGIDINMGCPDSSIVEKGCCSGLINNHSLVKEIIESTKKGAGNLPVSVKTRIGYSTIDIENWIGFLLEQNLDALTLHLRTVAELSKLPAHWEVMNRVIQLRDNINKNTCIIGNGDISSYEDGLKKHTQYHCDGLMIGRGILHNIWLFNTRFDISHVTIKERVQLLAQHIQLFEETWGNKKHFDILKKFYKIYLSGFPGANEMRFSLMHYNTAKETLQAIQNL